MQYAVRDIHAGSNQIPKGGEGEGLVTFSMLTFRNVTLAGILVPPSPMVRKLS